LITDYNDATVPDIIESDICIIGAGAAGLSIARSFIGTSMNVCVVESGGLSGEEKTQSLYDGSSMGTQHFDPGTSRRRVFGGSCSGWGGGCIPLGKMDAREWVPNSGWPIAYEELKPYYAQAQSFCDIESHRFVEDSFLTPPSYPPLRFDGGSIVNKYFALSPLRFGKAYLAEFEQAENINVLLHANLLEMEAYLSGSAVKFARIGSLNGHRGLVRAAHYVLACGGIENARALLLSNSVTPEGLGNDHGLVGRYFMDHPSCKLGSVFCDKPDQLARPYDRDLGSPYNSNKEKKAALSFPEICLTEEAQKKHQILNARVRPFAVEGPVPKGIQALREFKVALRARKLKNDENQTLNSRVSLSLVKNGEPLGLKAIPPSKDGFIRLALRIGLGIGDIAQAFVNKLAKKPTVRSHHVDLIGYFEQQPNSHSRILLGDKIDALGQRKVCIDWQLTALDRHTYRTAAMLFGTELAKACNGRFQIAPWLEEDDSTESLVYGTAHHLGTTRMSDDPMLGVVDRNCRVHSIDNLHIAGSSIFPTGGWAFPTFTIVAMSLRLAEHLRMSLMLDREESSAEVDMVDMVDSDSTALTELEISQQGDTVKNEPAEVDG
jgi:choline dehydrogenase-like flavoprotein